MVYCYLRNLSLAKYSDLNRQIEEFKQNQEDAIKHPVSKYDTFVIKQNCINENIESQIHEAKEKLKSLKRSIKDEKYCGKHHHHEHEHQQKHHPHHGQQQQSSHHKQPSNRKNFHPHQHGCPSHRDGSIHHRGGDGGIGIATGPTTADTTMSSIDAGDCTCFCIRDRCIGNDCSNPDKVID